MSKNLDRPASMRSFKLMTIYITAIARPLVKKGILSRDDILTELADNLPTDDKILEEDIKRLAAEIGLW